MTNTKPQIVKTDPAHSKNVLGVAVDVFLDGDMTGGQYTTYRCVVPPNVGPPPHRHVDFDEAFYVVEGTFEFLCDDQTHVVGPGTYVFAPRGTTHTFLNVGEAEGSFIGTATPSGHEAFFVEADQMVKSGPLTIPDVVALCERHGIEVAPPSA